MPARVPIPGSTTLHSGDGSWLPANADLRLTPTLIIRRPKQAGDVAEKLLSGSFHLGSREDAEEMLRADPSDLEAVRNFAKQYRLEVTADNVAARSIKVEGTAAALGQAFGVKIEWRTDAKGRRYLSYQGEITVPADLAGVVLAVLGLDQRPIARHGAGA